QALPINTQRRAQMETAKRSKSLEETLKMFQMAWPVDVVGLASAYGLKVWEVDLPNNISGKIQKDGKHGGPSGYSVLINSNDASSRKRFTVAHEIGHFLLHRSQIGDGLTDDALYRSGLSTLQEVQANKIAAGILMPYALIERA